MVRNESKSKLCLKKEFYDGFSMDSPPERLPPSTSKLTTTPSNMPGMRPLIIIFIRSFVIN